jgi:hypothetical protein
MKLASCLFVCVFIFCLSSLQSCSGDPKHPAELASADSLAKVVHTADSIFKTVDSLTVKKTLQQINYSLAYIQLNQKDTIDREEGRLLLNFYQLKRPLYVFTKHKSELSLKIVEQKQQSQNLAHDLRHNTLDAKLNIGNCLQDERRHAAPIIYSSETLVTAINEALKKFKEQYPLIESRVNALKAKGGKEPQGLDKMNDDEEKD